MILHFDVLFMLVISRVQQTRLNYLKSMKQDQIRALDGSIRCHGRPSRSRWQGQGSLRLVQGLQYVVPCWVLVKIHKNIELGEKAANKYLCICFKVGQDGCSNKNNGEERASRNSWTIQQNICFLEELRDEIKVAGYVPNTSLIHDVEDDVQEQLLNSHSEKLAIAFGLLNTSPDTMIHVQKNLQVWRLLQPSIRLCLLPLIPFLDTFMLL